MHKQISGVPDVKSKETRSLVKLARNDYNRSMERLQVVKEKYRTIKKSNIKERERMERDERLKELFQFKGMVKKISFLP